MTAALTLLRESADSKAAELRAKIAHAEGQAERYKSKLDQLYQELETKVQELSRSYLSIPVSSSTTTATGGRRTRRWSLDQPILSLIRSMKNPIIDAPQVWAFWNEQHPEQRVERSTIRGVLERLERDGHLKEHESGRRGRRNVRTYHLPSVMVEGGVKESIVKEANTAN